MDGIPARRASVAAEELRDGSVERSAVAGFGSVVDALEGALHVADDEPA
jgi:hypothetical protein